MECVGVSAWLPESLKNETRTLHLQAERSAFMGRLLRGRMERPAYAALLRNLHAIYAALEPALRRHAKHPVIAPLVLPALFREPALRRDLERLQGPGWADALVLQPAAQDYVERLRMLDAQHPELLAAHSYVRYLGDLSGGQMLDRIVRDSLRLGTGSNVGADFYDFGDAQATSATRIAYRQALASLPVSAEDGAAIVAEARHAFELHGRLFEQLAMLDGQGAAG